MGWTMNAQRSRCITIPYAFFPKYNISGWAFFFNQKLFTDHKVILPCRDLSAGLLDHKQIANLYRNAHPCSWHTVGTLCTSFCYLFIHPPICLSDPPLILGNRSKGHSSCHVTFWDELQWLWHGGFHSPTPIHDWVLTWSSECSWDKAEMNRPGCLAEKLLLLHGQATL